MNRIRSTGIARRINPAAQAGILGQIQDQIRSLESNINQIVTEYNSEVYPVLNSLPTGRSDSRWRLPKLLSTKERGLDGTTVFVDLRATSVSDGGRFWDPAGLRPNTIKESFSALQVRLSELSDSLRREIASISSTVDEGVILLIDALDGRIGDNQANILQLAKDIYDETFFSLDGDGDPNLDIYSVRDMVHAVLDLHGGGWNASIALSHAGVGGHPLTVEDEGVLLSGAVTSIDFIGEGVTATQPFAGQIEVTIPRWADDLSVEDEGVQVEAATTIINFEGAGVTAAAGGGAGEVVVTIAGAGPGSNASSAKTIVGNALAGDTVNDCHVLDLGDGVLLAATIAAATTGADIYVRPGLYDFDAGDLGSVVIPSGVRVRGAGWSHTIISCSFSHAYGDNHAFMLMSESTLEDIGIFCPAPTIDQSPWAYYVVECYGYGTTVSRVRILFDDYWNAIQGLGTNYYVSSTLGAFGSHSMGVDYTALQPNRFVDCEAHKVPYDPDGSGSDVIDWVDCYVNEGGFVWLSASAVFSRCYGEGGRRGVHVRGQAIVDHCHVVNEVSGGYYEGIYGYLLTIDDNGQLNVSTNKVTMAATSAPQRGIYIYAYCSTFHGNTVVVPTGKFGGAHPSAIAIHVAFGQLNNVVSNIASGWERGILLDSGADNNIVVGNNLGTIATLVDNGTSNEKGHNIYGSGIPV